jgi:hypothetical protein
MDEDKEYGRKIDEKECDGERVKVLMWRQDAGIRRFFGF